jgi:hypothetical protein
MEVDNTNAGFATARGTKGQSPQQIIANRKAVNRTNEMMVFPASLGVHCTLMRFFQYSYGGTTGSKQNHIKDIVLPLPRQLQDSFKVNIMGDELDIIGNAAAQAANSPESANKLAKELGKATVQGLTDLGTAVKNGNFASAVGVTADVGQFLVRAGLGSVTPNIANGISAGRGTAINPFATLVFKGVDLKAHTLEWLLSPESEEESRTLKDIIRTIQSMVLPKVQSPLGINTGIDAVDRGIMKYPAMVDVYFQGIDMNYYFKFKTSMISQFSVDYTPNGLAINRGGRPSALRISMTLQEAFIHTADDYNVDDLAYEAIAEITNDDELRTASQPEEFELTSSSDSVANSTGGTNKPVLGATSSLEAFENSGETVMTPDGKSPAQPPTNAGLADEYIVGQNVYSLNQLMAEGVDKEEILANPQTYVPSTVQVQ